MMSALLACWFFETHPHAIGLITAPVNRQISEIIFKEMRRILPNGPFAPKANSLFKQHDWWVNGYATSSGDAWQGKHSPGGILIIFDEASGVDSVFWERSHSMFESGRNNHYFLAIGNPYTMSSPMFMEEQTGKYNVLSMSALTHPNVVLKREVIPGAISYETVKERIKLECHPALSHEMYKAFQFEDSWFVSDTPQFDIQIKGVYPEQSDFSLWSEQDLYNLQQPILDSKDYKVAIGCDVARYGSCLTTFCVRRGPNIVHLVGHRGFNIVQTATKIKELCNQYATRNQLATQIPCYIDGTGLGAGVCDLKGTAASSYNFIEVNNSSKPSESFDGYVPNKRSELWINARDMASNKQVSITMLPQDTQSVLIKELRMPEFYIDMAGRTCLESKDDITKRLKASPDFGDAFALSLMLPQKHFESHF